ncbi:hypothetical protein [Streptomyces sp. SID14478]|uniref:hypothetical protein n=1 Tax=Streptomyces sp. SID14478 TaxID=2706073 RepID=UPI001EF1A3A6|nr:hypothetical protein [Streptomyces sp. SID14478]
MNTHLRKGTLALAAMAAVAGAAAATTPAAAATDPQFLAASELPPHPHSAWVAGPVTAGQPDPLPMCVGAALPSTSEHRVFRTDYDTAALQVTVVERSVQRAKDYVALLREDMSGCPHELVTQDPDVTATERFYGPLDVGDGAEVFGINTTTTWGATDINLFSIGRVGNVVTVVQWGEMGDFTNAPVDDFKQTTITAVNKLS